MKGFITDDGEYGVFSYEKQWMVVYRNQQLDVFKTQAQCKKYITTHTANLKTVPSEDPAIKKVAKVKARTKKSSETISKKKN